jgi:hypothetical protein
LRATISFNGRAIFQMKRADHGHLRGPATGLTPGNWQDGSDEAFAALITEEEGKCGLRSQVPDKTAMRLP